MTATFGPADFAVAMSSLGPFETAPHVAVACSGGADSLALALLAQDWARAAGGRSTALIVDHAMRPESGREAETVRGRLAAEGVDAVVLKRQGLPLTADRQAAARKARYDLMTRWCRDAGVLHLLLGHHQGDQAETLMLRLGRGSGVDGLAAIAPVVENADLRLLRPLLDVPRDRLVAFLRGRNVEWVDDPSNEDPSFARVRMRTLLPGLAREGLNETRLAATARRMARARVVLEAAATELLARSVAIYPEGYATLAPAILAAAPEDTALRALSRLLTCIGGAGHGPRLERLERLYRWILRNESGGRTLGGCRVIRRADSNLLVCREAAATANPIEAKRGALWDGRFRLLASGGEEESIACLGAAGWRQVCSSEAELAARGLPSVVRNTLPAILRLEEVAEVPHLLYRKMLRERNANDSLSVAFQPPRPLAPAPFSAVVGYA